MSEFRKARMLKNMALKEQARMPQFIQRQNLLSEEIAQLEALLARIGVLREEAGGEEVRAAHRLQSNRWYELQLIEQEQTLRAKLDFLEIELADVRKALRRMSHKKQRVTEKAEDALRLARLEREAVLERAQVMPLRMPRS